MNKLDLIFEKEPPEVQRKLMNLLIQYNAMMQYVKNANEDKFEVDLLLPFKTAQQKKQFIQNFKSRSHNKNTHREQIKHQNLPPTNRTQDNIESQRSPKIEHNQNQKEHQKYEEVISPQRSDQSQISYELTNENYEMSERRKTLSIRDISSIIKEKIKNAVQIIRQENQAQYQTFKVLQKSNHQEHSKNSIKLNRVEMEDYQEHDGMILHNLNNSHSPQGHRRQMEKEIKIIEGDDHEYDNHSAIRQRSFNDSSEIRNQILIEDLNQFKDSQEKPKQNNLAPQNSNHEELKQGQVNIPPLNGKSFKSYLQSSREQLQKQKLNQEQKNTQKNKQTENIKNMKQKLTDKYGSKKVSNPNIRQKYSQFLKKNHRDFDRIYETIRKEIKRNETQLVKSRRQDPILVLQQNISDAYSQEDRIFKQEIIKDYQKHIVVHNQNMSSEDLVRYFRYLLQNAKSLYVKHLRKGR